MKVEQIYTGCLAQGAYYVESNGEVAIIDPLREVSPYMERAEKDPQLKHRDFIAEIPHEELGKARVESIPMRMSETPWKLERPPPLLGEHSAEIYTELLDVTPEELITLYEEGIA